MINLSTYKKKIKKGVLKMTKNKNNSSTVKATKGVDVIYLSSRDEENGVDIILDLQGYKLEAI